MRCEFLAAGLILAGPAFAHRRIESLGQGSDQFRQRGMLNGGLQLGLGSLGPGDL